MNTKERVKEFNDTLKGSSKSHIIRPYNPSQKDINYEI